MSPASDLDQDFEAGLRLARESYQKKIAAKDAELHRRLVELDRKDEEIKVLKARLEKVHRLYEDAQREIVTMTAKISKLTKFRNNVLASVNDGPNGEEEPDFAQSASSAGPDSSLDRDPLSRRRSVSRDTYDKDNLSPLNKNRAGNMEDTCSVPALVAPPCHGVRMKLTNISVNTTTVFARATGPQEKSSATRASAVRLKHKPSSESNGSTTAHDMFYPPRPLHQAASLPLSDDPPRQPSSHYNVTFDDESGAADLSNSSSRRGSHNRSSSASATGISFLSSGGSEDGDANNIENNAPPSVDGREFFRKARAELTYNDVREVATLDGAPLSLANFVLPRKCLKVMEAARQFNAKQRSRSDTLRIAEELLYGKEEMLNEFRKLL